MKVVLVRHAIAQDREDYRLQGGTDDDLRPLTLDGIRRMKKAAKGLVKLIKRPDLILTSPLVRAQQTTEILTAVFAKEWKEHTSASPIPMMTLDLLRPEEHPKHLGDWMKAQTDDLNDDSWLVVVGHEPQLSAVVGWSLGATARSPIVMKKGGVCLLQFPHHLEAGKGQLLWLATSPMLRN
jgi:phosphohistidine phosphatase